MTDIALSVVIPAWNEERRLPATLSRILDYLRPRGVTFEVVVADDGSRDGTVSVVDSLREPAVRVLPGEVNRGKGHAVKRGMLAARGHHRLMTDADLSTPIEDLERLEAALRGGAEVAIGSRALESSRVEIRQSAFREGMGRVFNLGVRALLLPDLRDTQCGFKLFTADAAEAAFSATRLDGFCFDVEALVAARRRGFRVVEVPVTWRNDIATRVGMRKGAMAYLDLLRVRANLARGFYDR